MKDEAPAHVRIEGGSSIAGRDVNAANSGALRQFPGQGMFAATAADNENFHER